MTTITIQDKSTPIKKDKTYHIIKEVQSSEEKTTNKKKESDGVFSPSKKTLRSDYATDVYHVR